jgi:hypothetical protein
VQISSSIAVPASQRISLIEVFKRVLGIEGTLPRKLSADTWQRSLPLAVVVLMGMVSLDKLRCPKRVERECLLQLFKTETTPEENRVTA